MEGRRLGALVYRQIQSVPVNFFTYFAVGGVAAVVDIAGFMVLTGVFKIAWFWAALVSFVAAATLNYVLSIRFAFESGVRFRRHHEFMLVLLVSAIGLLFNEAVLWALIEAVGVASLPAKVCATGIVFLWNYSARQNFIFRAAR